MPSKGNKCCCPDDGTVTCIHCIDEVAPAIWTVTFSGIGAGTCPSGYCAGVNRTWRLALSVASPGYCVWNEVITGLAACSGRTQMLAELLVYSGTNGILLQLTSIPSGIIVQIYDKFPAAAPHNCLTSHTLDSVVGDATCTGWPSTVIVSPG